MLNPEFVGNASHFQTQDKSARRSKEHLEYIDNTCTYMCGAPIFEFGLWPYVPHLTVFFLSVIFLWAFKKTTEGEAAVATAYLVLGMGFSLGILIILGLGVEASKNIEEFTKRKTQKKKQVLRVDGDESKRGYTVRQDLDAFQGNKKGDPFQDRSGSTELSQRHRNLTERNSSRLLNALQGAESRSPYPQSQLSAYGEMNPSASSQDIESQGLGDDTHYDPSALRTMSLSGITRAVTSKIVEASVILAIIFIWLLYGMLFQLSQDFFPLSVDVGLSLFIFLCTQASYIQTWYDNVLARYIVISIWAGMLMIDPTHHGNVPSSSEIPVWRLMIRMILFFVVYCLAEADTTAQINYWLRFCNRKKLIRNLPKLVTPPIEQIDTPLKRRIYAIQRIAFQSTYVLFLPWIVWPFACIHILWLIYRIRTTILENNQGLMKKYEEISIHSSGLIENPPEQSLPTEFSYDSVHRQPQPRTHSTFDTRNGAAPHYTEDAKMIFRAEVPPRAPVEYYNGPSTTGHPSARGTAPRIASTTHYRGGPPSYSTRGGEQRKYVQNYTEDVAPPRHVPITASRRALDTVSMRDHRSDAHEFPQSYPPEYGEPVREETRREPRVSNAPRELVYDRGGPSSQPTSPRGRGVPRRLMTRGMSSRGGRATRPHRAREGDRRSARGSVSTEPGPPLPPRAYREEEEHERGVGLPHEEDPGFRSEDEFKTMPWHGEGGGVTLEE